MPLPPANREGGRRLPGMVGVSLHLRVGGCRGPAAAPSALQTEIPGSQEGSPLWKPDLWARPLAHADLALL